MEEGSTVSDDRVPHGRSGVDDDPDAPWRPDYDGWSELAPPHDDQDRGLRPALGSDGSRRPTEQWSRTDDERRPEPVAPAGARDVTAAPKVPPAATLASVDGQPSSATFGDLVLSGFAVLVAVLVAGVATVLLPVETTADAVVSAPNVPERAEVAWTSAVEGIVDDVVAGGGVVVVTSNAGVTAFALEGGAQNWHRPAGDDDATLDRIAVIGGQLAMQERGPGGRSMVRVLDAVTGAESWDSADAAGSFTIAGTSDRPLLVHRQRVDGGTLLELIDPIDGSAIGESLRVSAVAAAGVDLAVEPSDRRVAVWSLEDREIAAGPVDSFNLRTVAAIDDRVVALDLEGRIVVFDDRGLRADEQPFVSDASNDFAARAELVGVVESAGLGIIASGSSLGFTVDDGRIETVWQRLGRVSEPVQTAAGPRSLLVGPTGDLGEIRETIIDPVDGTTIVATDAAGTRERNALIGHEGYVLAPAVGAAERIVEAFEHDGSPLWSLPIASDARYEVTGGVVVVVERTPDGSTVSVAR